MNSISASWAKPRCLRGAALGVLLCAQLPAIAIAGHPEQADERASEAYQCVLRCDEQNVEYTHDLVGPGADVAGARRHARKRYVLCLHHCDPRLSMHATLMRLFPPLGRLSAIREQALSTAEQLQLCQDDCEESRLACLDAQFQNKPLCQGGAQACNDRCALAFGAQEGDGRE